MQIYSGYQCGRKASETSEISFISIKLSEWWLYAHRGDAGAKQARSLGGHLKYCTRITLINSMWFYKFYILNKKVRINLISHDANNA